MNVDSPLQVVTGFLDAIERGDLEGARQFLCAERFSYRGPLDHFTCVDDFLADLARITTILKRIERRRFFTDGEEVCVIVTYITTLPEIANTRAAHWVQVSGGVIVSIEGFLDARAYARMFDPEL